MAAFTWLECHLTEHEKEVGHCESPWRSRVIINTDVNVQVVALAMATGCGKYDHTAFMHISRQDTPYDFTI